ncbi:MAG TPA: pantetheine-phosphate adenylyltransferase [Bdellovibrionota bacterium]|jgi:pantetheine-phosphate adenylyltransferase|nr:pantetheine-phosphate adenylyltransferase [Bdellovibrionota bacterium]
MLRAIYPGSFDPITVGHLDILDRALQICSEVTVVVAGSGRKNALFTTEERVALIRDVVADRPGVKVDQTTGLIMDYARNHKIGAVVRGLRAASDFEYEFMMASMNKKLNPEVETVFMMTSQNYYFVSSTMIKELYLYGGDISPYVPPLVVERLKAKFAGGAAK